MTYLETEKIGENFKSSYLKIGFFQSLIYRSLHLSTFLISEKSKNDELKRVFEKNIELNTSIEKFKEWQSKFEGSESIDQIIIEKAFVDKFQLFESLLFDLTFSLFSRFPKFLKKIDNNTNISFDDLFTANTIDDLQLLVAENRTRQLIQFNSIRKYIYQIEKVFGIKFGLDEEHLKKIQLISRLRNLIIHNGCIMNSTTLRELKFEQIETGLKIGQNVITYITVNEFELNNNLWIVANKIIDTVKLRENQIYSYHNSKL
jgi:hypothetical protein